MISRRRAPILAAIVLLTASCGSRVHDSRTGPPPSNTAVGGSEASIAPGQSTASPTEVTRAGSGNRSQVQEPTKNPGSANVVIPEDGWVTWDQAKNWWPHPGLLRWLNPTPLIEAIHVGATGDPATTMSGVVLLYAPKNAKEYGWTDAGRMTRQAKGYEVDVMYAPNGTEGNFDLPSQASTKPIIVRGGPGRTWEAYSGDSDEPAMRIVQWKKSAGGKAVLHFLVWTDISVTTEQAVAFANGLAEF